MSILHLFCSLIAFQLIYLWIELLIWCLKRYKAVKYQVFALSVLTLISMFFLCDPSMLQQEMNLLFDVNPSQFQNPFEGSFLVKQLLENFELLRPILFFNQETQSTGEL
jgi:hypothetical protein